MGPWRFVAVAVVLGLATEARASITYHFVNYPDDQAGSTLSGFITLDHLDAGLVMDNVQSWSITITPPDGGRDHVELDRSGCGAAAPGHDRPVGDGDDDQERQRIHAVHE